MALNTLECNCLKPLHFKSVELLWVKCVCNCCCRQWPCVVHVDRLGCEFWLGPKRARCCFRCTSWHWQGMMNLTFHRFVLAEFVMVCVSEDCLVLSSRWCQPSRFHREASEFAL